MRLTLSLLIITAWVAAPIVRAQQTAASQPAASQSAMTQQAAVQANEGRPAAAPLPGTGAAHPARRSRPRESRSRRAITSAAATAATAQRSAAADKAGGVLALGATDITGNKELPKVMVIVPWKDSLGAGGVVKPTDSLLDEVLTPVDRGVFQRQVRYYEQLDGAGQKTPAEPTRRVAPAGDSR